MTGIRHSGGFTLLEIIVNIAIIAILAAISIPAYTIFKDKANSGKAKSDLRAIQNAVELLASDTEKWPGGIVVGLINKKKISDLSEKASGLITEDSKIFPNWAGPYIESNPKDPWDRDYFFEGDYKISGTKYAVLGSYGPIEKNGKKLVSDDDVILILPIK